MNESATSAIQYTSAQAAALEAQGNLLIAAGAGAGKTRTLVDRAIREITQGSPPASLDELLIVTFTEAAASELRDRIRIRLDEICEQQPDSEHLHHQSALVEQARISTLHQFCLEVIRERFDELELDPEFVIMSETDTRQLQEEILDQLIERCYEDGDPLSEEIRTWIRSQGRGVESNLREVILQINNYARTLPSPAEWFKKQHSYLSEETPDQWKSWWREYISNFLEEWRHSMEHLGENRLPDRAIQLLETLQQANRISDFRLETTAEVLRTLSEFYEESPRGTKQHVKPWQPQMTTAAMLGSLLGEALDFSPLEEDWELTRRGKLATLELASRYMEQYQKARLDSGWVDFQDLEQYALRILMDPDGNPTPAALEWRGRLSRVFVDEYQDINAAQDAILRMVSREGAEGNRFLVGDVKQSIYRFRLADPRIFQSYYREWSNQPEAGRKISLQDNFRSHEAILAFVNRAFEELFHPELGGVAYDEDARLLFGAAQSRKAMSIAADNFTRPRVELSLTILDKPTPGAEAEDSDEASEEAASEAVSIARKLRNLRASGLLIGEGTREERPVDWGDMVVLVRSPKRNAETFQKAFNQEGIPLIANTGGFLESREVQDLLALLKTLDNPLQDVPILAILRSPFGQITAAELAEIRTRSQAVHFWDAFQEFIHTDPEDATDHSHEEKELRKRAERFYHNFQTWRQALRKGTLAGALELAIQTVDYESWFLGMDDAPERMANVRRMVSLASGFDRRYRKGLFRFLRYIELLEKTETDLMPPSPPAQGAVRLMSVHQSKGLEFPVVVVADLARKFNMTDLRQTVILDEYFGLCSRVHRPGSHSQYPSLPYLLAKNRQKREALGEELRLLYVALTRASERLLLFGTLTRNKFEERVETTDQTVDLMSVEKSNNWLEWILQVTPLVADTEGHGAPVRDFSWEITTNTNFDSEESDAAMQDETGLSVNEKSKSEELEAAGESWAERMAWIYPHEESARLPGKTSVSRIKSSLSAVNPDSEIVNDPALLEEMEEPGDLKAVEPDDSVAKKKPEKVAATSDLSAAERGSALHLLMEQLPLQQEWKNRSELQEFASELVYAGKMTAAQADSLDWTGVLWFLKSELGSQLIEIAKGSGEARLMREVPFTWWTDLNGLVRLGWEREAAIQAGMDPYQPGKKMKGKPEQLLMFEEASSDPGVEPDRVVIQGVIDLVVELESECWLVDYKTDHFPLSELGSKKREHSPQMRTYREALQALSGKPVTRSELVFIHAQKVASVG